MAEQMTMRESEAAKYLGISPRTLQKYRYNREPPTYIKMGRAIRYLKSDLDSFLKEKRILTNKL